MEVTYQTGGFVPNDSYFLSMGRSASCAKNQVDEFFSIVTNYVFEHICPCGHFYTSCMQHSKDAYCFSTNNYRRLDGYPPCRKRLIRRVSRKKES